MSQSDMVPAVASEKQTRPATKTELPAVPRRWLDTREAAAYVGVSYHHLGKLRERQKGPPYRHFGRVVIYDIRELDAFMERLPREEA